MDGLILPGYREQTAQLDEVNEAKSSLSEESCSVFY